VSVPTRRALSGALVLVAALTTFPAAAGADPGGSAAEQAHAAAEQAVADVELLVDQLDAQLAAQAVARLALAGSVAASISAEGDALDAAATAAAARAQHARTVRALYTSGGALAVYSSLLGAESLADLASRTMVAERVLAGAASGAEQATAAHAVALRTHHQEARVADGHVAVAAAAEDATEAVEQTLARAREALAGLSEAARAADAAEQALRQVREAERLVALSRAAGGPSHSLPGSSIPDGFRALYEQAASRCPGMRWTQLAAVGQVETRHGRNNGPSSAGAQGPMQFMPATFAQYGVDGDGDGVADPWNPADAIHSAAIYLCVNGAGVGTPQAERRALLRYNNAGWYVDLVQNAEAQIITGA